MKKHLPLILLFLACISADAPTAPPAYSNDFEKAKLGPVPDDLMPLNGTFTIVDVDKNKCLELAPNPLGGNGFLFGPAGAVTGTVSARIWSAPTGRRFPEFGIGANDAGGYKLILVPAQGILELRKGEDAVASVPFQCKPQSWTRFALQVKKKSDGKFAINGKAWLDGSAEPTAWMLTAKTPDVPPAGRASAWGMAYSGKPIRFDDLAYRPQ
ncbi:MAG TPA: hypothetical protein VFC78_09500 [Tepidisphaeraceae bacterium]|nr:hypothetical protein [Tepidisphaeraceae bacterium]